MTRPPEFEPLLDEVLAPESGGVREASLARTLAAVRARRVRRRLGAAAVTLAFVTTTALLLLRPTRPEAVRVIATSKPSLTIITSRPLQPGQLVQTRLDSVRLIESAPMAFATVSTADAMPAVHEIDDQRLLALASDRPAALVRPAGERATLLFLDEPATEVPATDLH